MPSYYSEYPLEWLVGEFPDTVVGRSPGTVELPDPGLEPWVRPGWRGRGRPDVDGFLDAVCRLPVTRLAFRGLLVDDDTLARVAALPGLRALSLVDCVNISDAGLRTLTGLSQLETLELRGVWHNGSSDGGITSAGLESLAALPRLARISVSPWENTKEFRREVMLLGRGPQHPPDWRAHVGLDDSVARALAGCRSLVDVQLHGADDLTAAGLAQLAALPALEALLVDSNSALEPGDLACLRRAPHLRRLGLRNFHGLVDRSFAALGALTMLETLSLVNSGLTDAGVRHLEPLQRLHTLDLRFHHKLTERSLDSVVALTSLTALNLELTMDALTDVGVARLAGMETLTHLELGYMRRPLTNASLAALGHSARLETLTLGSVELTDAGVATLARARRLRKLELWDAPRLGDAAIAALGELSSLTTLWLGDVGPLSDRGLAVLATLPRLTSLGLRTPQLTDDGLRALSEAPGLRSLFLDDCAQVTDEGVVTLAKLRQLRCLNLLSLNHHPSLQITDRGLRALAGLPRLAGLDLSGVAGATQDGLRMLIENPSLVSLKLPAWEQQPTAFRQALAAHPWGHVILDSPWPC